MRCARAARRCIRSVADSALLSSGLRPLARNPEMPTCRGVAAPRDTAGRRPASLATRVRLRAPAALLVNCGRTRPAARCPEVRCRTAAAALGPRPPWLLASDTTEPASDASAGPPAAGAAADTASRSSPAPPASLLMPMAAAAPSASARVREGAATLALLLSESSDCSTTMVDRLSLRRRFPARFCDIPSQTARRMPRTLLWRGECRSSSLLAAEALERPSRAPPAAPPPPRRMPARLMPSKRDSVSARGRWAGSCAGVRGRRAGAVAKRAAGSNKAEASARRTRTGSPACLPARTGTGGKEETQRKKTPSRLRGKLKSRVGQRPALHTLSVRTQRCHHTTIVALR